MSLKDPYSTGRLSCMAKMVSQGTNPSLFPLHILEDAKGLHVSSRGFGLSFPLTVYTILPPSDNVWAEAVFLVLEPFGRPRPRFTGDCSVDPGSRHSGGLVSLFRLLAVPSFSNGPSSLALLGRV